MCVYIYVYRHADDFHTYGSTFLRLHHDCCQLSLQFLVGIVPVWSPTAAGPPFQQNPVHTEAFVPKCCGLSPVSALPKYSALRKLTRVYQVNFHFANFEERKADMLEELGLGNGK